MGGGVIIVVNTHVFHSVGLVRSSIFDIRFSILIKKIRRVISQVESSKYLYTGKKGPSRPVFQGRHLPVNRGYKLQSLTVKRSQSQARIRSVPKPYPPWG